MELHLVNPRIDLNCDLGELPDGGRDAELLGTVTSANIACGFHAGDPMSMRRTVDWAVEQGVAIGAHPSFFDRENFGRREMAVTPAEVRELMLYQLGALAAITQARGAKLRHVKPHGALYNMAARDRVLAAAIAHAVRDFDSSLILYGLSGSFSISEAGAAGLRTASEVFADRTYRADGSLTPRSEAHAMVEDEQDSIEQVLRMITTGTVRATDGSDVPIVAETVCIHGDQPRSVEFARTIRQKLIGHNISIEAPR